MYPLIRMAFKSWQARCLPDLELGQDHVSTHRCWPWDIDPWMELNNGRTLTLYDLGRIPLGARSGLVSVLKENEWGLTVAGSTIRYRRRILPFEKFTMRSRGVGWDDKFFYIEQSMWKKNGECASHVVIRSAFTSKSGIVAPEKVAALLGFPDQSPALPQFIQDWIALEATRPWPPMGIKDT